MSHRNSVKQTHSNKKNQPPPPNHETARPEKPKSTVASKIEIKCDQSSPQQIYSLMENNQKVIPGYNFQSLFRKKSHIRLARKKIKEQSQKKNCSLKQDATERQTKNVQKGHWSSEQNKLYHWFLQLHSRHFVVKELRRADKIFKSMASFIRTREAEQCRSHHQKMQKKYHSFYNILSKLRMDFYSTLGQDLLKIELEQNGYKVKEATLISESELNNGDSFPRDCKFQQAEDSLGNGQDVAHEKDEHSNILGENYENGLHFSNMHY